MVLNDLIPTLQGLNRADKLQAIQVLLSELAKEEGIQLSPNSDYPIWSPFGANDAADTLLKMLDVHAKG